MLSWGDSFYGHRAYLVLLAGDNNKGPPWESSQEERARCEETPLTTVRGGFVGRGVGTCGGVGRIPENMSRRAHAMVGDGL